MSKPERPTRGHEKWNGLRLPWIAHLPFCTKPSTRLSLTVITAIPKCLGRTALRIASQSPVHANCLWILASWITQHFKGVPHSWRDRCTLFLHVVVQNHGNGRMLDFGLGVVKNNPDVLSQPFHRRKFCLWYCGPSIYERFDKSLSETMSGECQSIDDLSMNSFHSCRGGEMPR